MEHSMLARIRSNAQSTTLMSKLQSKEFINRQGLFRHGPEDGASLSPDVSCVGLVGLTSGLVPPAVALEAAAPPPPEAVAQQM